MVNVPPLLCSTPPPIDFGEDDDDSGLQSTLNLDENDEYSEYGLVSESHEVQLNAKAPSLPRLTTQTESVISDYSAQPPDFENGLITPPPLEVANNNIKAVATNAKQTAEAFNYQVTTAGKKFTQDYANYQPESPPTPPPLADVEQQQQQYLDEEVLEEEEEPNTNDNVPSLKLDSLSLYSSESVSAASTLSPIADDLAAVDAIEKPALCHQVTLEDVSDDSDEECSPKKPKELYIREGAKDFFAIEIVSTPTAKEAPARPNNEELTTELKTVNNVEKEQLQTTKQCDKPMLEEQLDFVAFPDDKPPEDLGQLEFNDVDDNDDFGDFADFSAAVTNANPPETTQTTKQTVPDAAETTLEDDFDDFQDFPSTTTFSTTTTAAAELSKPLANNVVNEDEDDDDFGDFSEPAFVSAPQPTPTTKIAVPPPPPPAALHLSITDRVKPVLDLMFPMSNVKPESIQQKPLANAQRIHFQAIEQAHALDYQWNNSEMRHALVRSLAIDSRNILFGDKWNANMPRFAANLSFDPLKPLKPINAAHSAVPPASEAVSSIDWKSANQSSSSQTLEGLDSTATQTREIETQPGASYGQKSHSDEDEPNSSNSYESSASFGPPDIDAPAAASAFVVAAATTSLSIALSADSNGYSFDSSEQQHQLQQTPQQQQQHLDLSGNQLDEMVTTSSYAVPLKETHIYTPSKSDTAVAKTTTLTPVDFDYEIASAGIIIDETVVKKEYRDVEYKPPDFGPETPNKLSASLPGNVAKTEDDDFSDFQCMPAPAALKATQQQQPTRNGTPTSFGEQMILSPAILLPQAIALAKPNIEWGDSAMSSINAEELARIEELFPQTQSVPQRQTAAPSISATVAQQHVEDDEWSDFVSVPVTQPQQQQQQPQTQQPHPVNLNINNNHKQLSTPQRQQQHPVNKDDDWSDFVSSSPLPTRAAPQFNSGAWQSANFYNNPLGLYQQQQQPTHSNVVAQKYQSYNNNNNNQVTPQQIHIMHDFSTLPTAGAAAPTYQQQHHQHHQLMLKQQQQQQRKRQQQTHQFQIGNAKVAPRISLIPDLSFVAPALPTNAGAFMSSLPKNSFNAKK